MYKIENHPILDLPKEEYVEFQFENRTLRLYRMPSSSRAYPMATEKKAEYYQIMFDDLGI